LGSNIADLSTTSSLQGRIPIGEEGEILGAAASDELDASSHALGTPKNAVVLRNVQQPARAAAVTAAGKRPQHDERLDPDPASFQL
jgi:hypothetical protein